MKKFALIALLVVIAINVTNLTGENIASVSNPTETIFLADSGHDEEDNYFS